MTILGTLEIVSVVLGILLMISESMSFGVHGEGRGLMHFAIIFFGKKCTFDLREERESLLDNTV